jgi:molybdenum cofactor biosynthesis enzyme
MMEAASAVFVAAIAIIDAGKAASKDSVAWALDITMLSRIQLV